MVRPSTAVEEDSFTYLLLGLRQTLPLLCGSGTSVLHGHVSEITTLVALLEEKRIGVGRSLDQSLVLDLRVLACLTA